MRLVVLSAPRTRMSKDQDTTSGFKQYQLDFTRYLRNPGRYQEPRGIESSRLLVYRDLVFKNISSLVSHAFPISKEILGDEEWDRLVAGFIRDHSNSSPFFAEVPEEFIDYLEHLSPCDLPAFFLELCHYEWVELAISLSDAKVPVGKNNLGENILEEKFVVSPLAWPLTYRFPVHLIGPDFQPSTPPEFLSYLIVYRGASYKTKFVSVNELTIRLLDLFDGLRSVEVALDVLWEDLSLGSSEARDRSAIEIVNQLFKNKIIIVQ